MAARRSAAGWVGIAFSIFAAGVPTQPVLAQMDGVWRSDGYGYVFEIRNGKLQTYEVTQATCVRAWEAIRDTARREGAEAVFRRPSDNYVFAILPHDGRASRRLQSDNSAGYVAIRRVRKLPGLCDHPTPDTPAGNFEVFAQTWAENYLWHGRQMDWPAVVAATRPRVTPQTTPVELFDILSGMIRPLQDSHTNIRATSLRRSYWGYREVSKRFLDEGFGNYFNVIVPRLTAVTDRNLLQPIRKWCNDQVQFAWLSDSVGYLRLLSFSDYTDDGTVASGLPALEAALDTIFARQAVDRMRALVLDVRLNSGGSDAYVIAVTSRLVARNHVAYSKQARRDPADPTKWTPLQPLTVSPSDRPSFRGPIVELIGPQTVSGGETFTQALMTRMPKVVRVGENTQGVFSDMLERQLPNGWRFALPNEVFRTADGKTFDITGIPPDVPVAVYPDDEVATGRDGALAKALEILGVRRQ